MNQLNRPIAEIALQYALDQACQEYRRAYDDVSAMPADPEVDARFQAAANKLANLIYCAVAIGWLSDPLAADRPKAPAPKTKPLRRPQDYVEPSWDSRGSRAR